MFKLLPSPHPFSSSLAVPLSHSLALYVFIVVCMCVCVFDNYPLYYFSRCTWRWYSTSVGERIPPHSPNTASQPIYPPFSSSGHTFQNQTAPLILYLLQILVLCSPVQYSCVSVVLRPLSASSNAAAAATCVFFFPLHHRCPSYCIFKGICIRECMFPPIIFLCLSVVLYVWSVCLSFCLSFFQSKDINNRRITTH